LNLNQIVESAILPNGMPRISKFSTIIISLKIHNEKLKKFIKIGSDDFNDVYHAIDHIATFLPARLLKIVTELKF